VFMRLCTNCIACTGCPGLPKTARFLAEPPTNRLQILASLCALAMCEEACEVHSKRSKLSPL
jgi:hypothetical protein